MTEKIQSIPARIKNIAKGGHVAGTEDIIDDVSGKTQKEINTETGTEISGLKAKDTSLDNRLGVVEELAEISVEGGTIGIATGTDFDNPTAEQRAKVTTVGAILDGADDELTAGSDGLVNSDGVVKLIHSGYIKGKGTTKFEWFFDGLLVDKKYTFTIENPDDIPDTAPDSAVLRMRLSVTKGSEDVDLFRVPKGTSLKEEYTFIISSEYLNYDYIRLGGYTADDYKIHFSIKQAVLNTDALQFYPHDNTPFVIEETPAESLYLHDGSGYLVRWNEAPNLSFEDNSSFAEHLGVSTVTSPTGYTNCIEIPNTYSLVYDINLKSLKIIARDTVTINHIILLSCLKGYPVDIHKGFIADYIHSTVNNAINEIKPYKRTNTVNEYFLNEYGLPQTSGNFILIIYNNPPKGECYINTFKDLTGESGKANCVLLNKEITNTLDYTVDNVLDVVDVQYKHQIISNSGYSGYSQSKVYITDSVKCAIITCFKYIYNPDIVGLFSKSSFTLFKGVSNYNEYLDQLPIPFSLNDFNINSPITSSITFRLHNTDKCKPLKITVKAFYVKQENETKPFISASCGSWSAKYHIGSDEVYTTNQFRIPPVLQEMAAAITVNPDGNVLYIKDFSVEYEDVNIADTQILLCAHLGFQTYAGQNTENAFKYAAVCGYKYCITNPIVSSDGIIMCYHEGNAVLYPPDSDTAIGLSASEFQSKTYDELQVYEIRKNGFISKIPTLKTFFSICAQTGMHPVFSAHPALTTEQWYEVKNMANSLGLTKKLVIKSNSVDIIRSAFNIFGDSIEGYGFFTNSVSYVSTLINELNSYNLANGFKLIEIKNSVVTDAIIEQVTSEGCRCGLYEIGNNGTEYYKQMIDKGISDFTDDFNCSNGLNW